MADKRKSAAIINSGSDSDSDVSDSEFQVMHVNQIPMMQRITFQYFQHLAKKQKNAPSKSPSQSPASPRRCAHRRWSSSPYHCNPHHLC